MAPLLTLSPGPKAMPGCCGQGRKAAFLQTDAGMGQQGLPAAAAGRGMRRLYFHGPREAPTALWEEPRRGAKPRWGSAPNRSREPCSL